MAANIIFFGDSICLGQHVSPHQCWVTRLSGMIEDRYGREFVVVNASVNGSTTRTALERISDSLQKFELSMIVIQFGLNDSNLWETDRGLPRVSSAGFRANLVEIIERARRFGAQEVILNTNHPTLKRTPEGKMFDQYQENNHRYSEIIREVAGADSEVTLVDVEAVVYGAVTDDSGLQTLLLEDGIHLALAGHDLYFEALKAPVISSLKRIVSAEVIRSG